MKILIVDDEVRVREGLKAVIDWETCGFAVCGEGVDGKDGLTKMLELKPDITLLDIKMPEWNGIEVAEMARDRGYSGKIIILSGYSDFKYAQSAIRFGVTAYLLKPIDEDELYDAVMKARLEIEQSAEASARQRESLKLAKSNLIHEVLQGSPVSVSAEDEQRMNLTGDSFQVAVVEYDKDSVPARQNPADFLARHIDAGRMEFIQIDNRLTIVLKSGECIRQFLCLMGKDKTYVENPNAFIALGRVVASFKDIAISYRDACSAIQRRFYYKRETRLVSYSEPAAPDHLPLPESRINSEIYLDMIYLCIAFGETGKIQELLTEMETYYRNSTMKAEKAIGHLAGFFSEVQKKAKENHPGLSVLPYADIMKKLYELNCLGDIMLWFNDEFCRLSASIGNRSVQDVISKLINYVGKYSSMNLTLESLAAIFGYNSAYLGRAFRDTVGESFNGYLERVRITNAVSLLGNTDMRIYEVAEKTGFTDLNYFHKKFKRHTGRSPNEYRKK